MTEPTDAAPTPAPTPEQPPAQPVDVPRHESDSFDDARDRRSYSEEDADYTVEETNAKEKAE